MLLTSDYNSETKENKRPLFSFQKMNKYYLFPFLVPLICFSAKYFIEPIKERHYHKNEDGDKEIDLSIEHQFVYHYTFINSLSFLLAGLLYFVSVSNSKTIKEKNPKRETLTNMEQLIKKDDGHIKKNIKIFFIFLLMSFILTAYTVIKGYALKNKTLEKRLYFLFFISVFNWPILKLKIYKHQKFSLLIALVGLILLFGIFYFNIFYNDKQYDYKFDIYLFFGSFIYSLYLVLTKKLTYSYELSPFLCLLVIGIMSTFLTVIGYAVIFLVSDGNKCSNLVDIFISKNKNENYLYYDNYFINTIIYLIIQIVLQVFIILVIYYFSPALFAVSDILSPMLSWINSSIKNKEDNAFIIIVNIVGYLIVLFAAFIYNEIIVCNFYGLEEYTKTAIDERARRDIDCDSYRDSTELDGYILEQLIDEKGKAIEMRNTTSSENDNVKDKKSNLNINIDNMEEIGNLYTSSEE